MRFPKVASRQLRPLPVLPVLLLRLLSCARKFACKYVFAKQAKQREDFLAEGPRVWGRNRGNRPSSVVACRGPETVSDARPIPRGVALSVLWALPCWEVQGVWKFPSGLRMASGAAHRSLSRSGAPALKGPVAMRRPLLAVVSRKVCNPCFSE